MYVFKPIHTANNHLQPLKQLLFQDESLTHTNT